MIERPILFSRKMVKSILSGKKTQTRRVIKIPASYSDAIVLKNGDRLWMREEWRTSSAFDGMPPYKLPDDAPIMFYGDNKHLAGRYRHAMFLPKRFARIWLTVTDVRIQRLQEITESDACAEGFLNIADFAAYWDTLNAKRGYDLASNPFVAAYTFERIMG